MNRLLQKSIVCTFYFLALMLSFQIKAQNIFSGEPVQVVGSFNGYVTTPYNADYRTCYYRRVSTPSGNPTDGRGQWVTNINVQNSGGNVTPINMTGGGGNGFLFISGPLSNRFQNKWVFSGVGSGTVGAINNISAFNSGNDMGLNMSTPGQYNFVFNDCGYTATNAKYYVGYTSSVVVQAFRTSQALVGGQAVINITTTSTPSPEQKIYVRYRVGTNDFTSLTSVVQASGSGTSWTATIPPPSCNTTVYYYVYSSTRTLAQISADSEMDRTLATLLWDDNAGNNYSIVFGSPLTYYQDADNDGFGNASVTQLSCAGAPTGYVDNSADCNDNQLQYLDADGDGFGATTIVGCGVANNSDCNDNQLQYLDFDGDGFGSTIQVACGVTNNSDCNDNQLQYQDLDGDTYGSLITVACGVSNNSDCNDNQLQYTDDDTDGFGSSTLTDCGVANNSDCYPTLLTYQDSDGDGFGNPAVLVACGTFNNTDCNDNQLQYTDDDSDGFGSSTLTDCGVANNFDCYPTQLTYQDSDGDGFGNSAVLVACGTFNNTDCNDNQLQYTDVDADGFGSTTYIDCGVANNSDCYPTQLTYQDSDGDGFGNPAVLVACGMFNNTDCNDNQLQYTDDDGDGFGSTTFTDCGVANNSDCYPTQLTYQDSDGDGFGNPAVLVACGTFNNTDCNDNQLQYTDVDGDGFGSTTFTDCGVANNFDCYPTQLTYQDSDGDGFGNPAVLVACGTFNNTDCNDNQLQYTDVDGDGFGSTAFTDCGVANNFDCYPTQLTYQDSDGDGFGNPAVLVACGTFNNTDCNDNQLQYTDVDGDGFGSTTFADCGVANNSDCYPTLLTYQDLDGDGLGNPSVLVACGTFNNTDCNDNDFFNLTGITFYQDADNDGYGNPTVTTSACTAPVGYVLNSLDCNDANAAVHPGVTEICYDGIDNNCDGTIDEGCTPIISTLQTTQCGIILPLISSNIYANLVSGAQGYRFKVTDMVTNQVQTIDKLLRVFSITQLGNYAFDRQYKVEVAIRYNNVWQPFYGSPCFVTTPATTSQVQSTQCGATLATMGDVIYADNVPYCTGYKFRIINLSNAANSIIVDRPTRDIRLNNNVGFTPEFNSTYSVEVAIKNTNGSYLPYGSLCNVSTPSFPTTQLQLSQCDALISSNSTIILADSYSGASQYRFRFTNSSLPYTYVFDKSVRSFTLSSVPGLLPATTYTVQVALNVGGVFGPYGKSCTITTPGGAREQVKDETAVFQAVAYPNPFAENFKLDVTASSDEMVNVRVYDMLGKQVEDRTINVSAINDIEIGTNYPSGVYNVIVSQAEHTKTVRVIKR